MHSKYIPVARDESATANEGVPITLAEGMRPALLDPAVLLNWGVGQKSGRPPTAKGIGAALSELGIANDELAVLLLGIQAAVNHLGTDESLPAGGAA